MFIFGESHVRGPKIVYDYIWVGNFQKTSPRTIQGSLRKDQKLVPKTAKDSPPTDGNRRPVGEVSSLKTMYFGRGIQILDSFPNHGPTGRSVGQGMGRHFSTVGGLPPCAINSYVEGELENLPHVKIENLEVP